MNPKPKDSEKHTSKDLKKFRELPQDEQELLLLADDSEKSTGKERKAVDRLIDEKSK